MNHITTLKNGMKIIISKSPPHGFDPFTASPEDLQKFGFPLRPTDPHQLARYQRVFGLLKDKGHFIAPTFQVNEEKFHGPRSPRTAGSETSTNWSGGVVFAPAGDSFTWVEGDWVVPNVSAPTQGKWYYSSSWIGIDGDGSPDVCQAGVECEVYQSGSAISRNIYPWWEWFPNSEVQITNLPISVGDMVTMLICSTSPGGAGSTTATVFFSNRTSGASTSFSFSAPTGTKLGGNSAEWIVEAPTVGGSQSAISDYGEVFFSVCEANTQKGITVNGGSGDSISMTSGGSVVSQGNLITPTIVQCLYAGEIP
ncbi:MAG: G1 family glutamic endopeptidase [Nitrosospira sp.]